MLVEFASVVDAVRCAAEIQRAMIDRDAEISDEQRIRFRVGINLGDIIVEGADIFGDGVNLAARLEGLAQPGGICISRVVRDQIRDKLPYAFEDMGEQSVKNIARPVRVYAMSADAVASLPQVGTAAQPISALRGMASWIAGMVGGRIAGWRARVDAKPSGSPLVASTSDTGKLPTFANLSSDPEQEYFADGITEDLTTDLSRMRFEPSSTDIGAPVLPRAQSCCSPSRSP
jgi:adenylate cyclase